jgi:hypothetical protein
MTKNTIRLSSEVSQKDVYRCQKVWARAVKRLCRLREGQIIGLLGREFTEAIEGAGWPVDFAHGFQQQILQRWVKILSDEQSVAGGKQVNVRIGSVAAQADEPAP